MNRLPSMIKECAIRVRAFARETKGSVSVEAAVMMPFLLGLFALTLVWFDAFRTKNAVLKATYSVADMVSRETTELPETFLPGLATVFEYMIDTPDPTSLRVTSFFCQADCTDEDLRELEMCWSWASGDYPKHTETTARGLESAVPLMAFGKGVVVMEGRVDYSPLFQRWLDEIQLRNTIVTQPRWMSQIALGDQRCLSDGGEDVGDTTDENALN
ncbi:MAG: hypothetical protein AAGG09_03950 [Pseudomonadota bacterium]